MNDPKIDLMPNIEIVKPEQRIINPGELGATIELVVREGIFSPEGKVTNRIGPKRSESFVQQFLQLLYGCFAFSTQSFPVSIIDVTNTARAVNMAKAGTDYFLGGIPTFDVKAAATDVTFGIIIGTGVTAPTITDYKVETIIPHATMNYGAVSFGAPAADATTSQVTITRNFANISGGGVTVNETILYCRAAYSGSTIGNFCIIRDVIGGGILVPNGQTLTVNYRPQAVV